MDTAGFVPALHELLREGRCIPHLQLHEGKVLATKVGGSWGLVKWISDLPGIGTANLSAFKRCMAAVGFTVDKLHEDYDKDSKKRKRTAKINALLFAHPLFPGHIPSLCRINHLQDLVDMQDNMIDQRNGLMTEMQGTMESMAKRLRQKETTISELQQATHLKNEEVLGSIFDLVSPGTSDTSGGPPADTSDTSGGPPASDAWDTSGGPPPAPCDFSTEFGYDLLDALS